MSFTVASVRHEIDAIAPADGAAGWDPVGLQVGDPEAIVESIAVCHEVTEPVVAALESAPVDLLVTYHPLLFHSTRSFTAGADAEGRAYRLSRLGTSLLVVHTAFDSAPGGTADALAAAIGLIQVSGFLPAWRSGTSKLVTFVPADKVDGVADALGSAGAGVIGNYQGCSFRAEGTGTFIPGSGSDPFSGRHGEMNAEAEVRLEMLVPTIRRDRVVEALVAAHPYETPVFDVYEVESNAGMIGRLGSLETPVAVSALGETVAEQLNTSVRVTSSGKEVERVAVIPGSGGDFVESAAAAGAQALVTGDVGHHRAQRALDLDMAVIDAGHTPTERPGVKTLYDLVSGIGPDTIDLTFMDPDPWEETAWKS